MNIIGNVLLSNIDVHEQSLAGVLRERIETCSARIGVLGLGYVGLPLVPAIASAGYDVVGFDIDPLKISELMEGRSYIRHIPNEMVAPLVADGRFVPTSDLSRIRDVDVALICVPTPLTRQREPDLSFVVSTAEAIAANLRPGQLIVLESTTYPGTTREVLRPILEQSGLRSGDDFFLAYSPEREDPGNSSFTTTTIPKVVGGDGADALELACKFYSRIIARTVPVSSAETAEAVKLTENIFRTVNIALVNELKLLFERMGIDIWEVIEAAKTKPFGYMPFYPGPGLGGHCLPIDPFYLTWKAREYGIATRFIELAGEINTAMPGHVVDRLAHALNQQSGRGLKDTRVLILGVAYKKDVDDTRESPAFRIMELLEERGAIVDYHDPYVPSLPSSRAHPALVGRSSVPLDPKILESYAAAVICVDHSNVDYGLVVNEVPIIIDTRNACRAGAPASHILLRA
ncbi:nucleotide sugar dehydrogenase [Chelativorans sp. J32]|uniref:nucleotide sugar dehydrogenase n=1 Tax=Chelativorans sp. J32 TaxID=935840 RepID=UPI0004B3FD9A|nr:nucleotide sugar dehydrogenase [Chelativorans sp. J32]